MNSIGCNFIAVGALESKDVDDLSFINKELINFGFFFSRYFTKVKWLMTKIRNIIENRNIHHICKKVS